MQDTFVCVYIIKGVGFAILIFRAVPKYREAAKTEIKILEFKKKKFTEFQVIK